MILGRALLLLVLTLACTTTMIIGGSAIQFGACTLTVADGGQLSRTGECSDEQGGLYLGALGIVKIEHGTFDRMRGVKVLDLSGNQISLLPESGFPPNLVTLSLQDNSIPHIEQLSFSTCPDLQQLSLSRNSIASISSGTFEYLTKLQYLQLNSNLLDSLPARLFDALKALKGLDLSDNRITSLPTSLFDSLQHFSSNSIYNNYFQ